MIMATFLIVSAIKKKVNLRIFWGIYIFIIRIFVLNTEELNLFLIPTCIPRATL